MKNRSKEGQVFVSKCFRCVYCNKKKSGAYRIVDGQRSCEKCNRVYDAPAAQVSCPLCKGTGVLR